MPEILYLPALVAAVWLGVRFGNRSFVMPSAANAVGLGLALFGLLALLPVIFFNFTWLTAILSVIGWGGWAAMFVMLRQVNRRIELWDRASAHAASTRSGTKRSQPQLVDLNQRRHRR